MPTFVGGCCPSCAGGVAAPLAVCPGGVAAPGAGCCVGLAIGPSALTTVPVGEAADCFSSLGETTNSDCISAAVFTTRFSCSSSPALLL